MGIFDKLKEPVFLKSDSELENQLVTLSELLNKASDDKIKKRIESEMNFVKAGINGEKQIAFELKNSHIPMYILHDLNLEYGELSAQIDYMVITKFHTYIIECKKLSGNIEINENGEFTRTIYYGKYPQREGIYSPITQNRRHIELIKQIRLTEKSNILTKALFERNFDNNPVLFTE